MLGFYAREKDDYPLGTIYDNSRAYLELPALELRARGEAAPLNRANVAATLATVNAQDDCTDFALNALLPMLYRYGSDAAGALPADLEDDVEDAVLASAYWFDEPGEHDMWFTTENHQVLWHAAELLVGQRYPDAEFRDGRTGAWHRDHAERHLDRWMEWRAKFGFSEWLSNHYYDEDLAALANVAAFAADEDLARRARDLIHLMSLDVSLHTYRGVFGCSHGRSYALDKLDPRRASMAGFCYLVLGAGEYRYCLSRSAVLLALERYEPPAVIDAALEDLRARTGEHREHHGLAVEDAPDHGLDPSMTDDQLFFWGSLAMGHRDVVDAAMASVTGSYARRLSEIAPASAYHRDPDAHDRYEPDPDTTAMTGADVYTYRTPAYLLSCAQDFRPGKMGFQQHPWQATVGDGTRAPTTAPDAVPVFTTHPRAATGIEAWGRVGILPRAAAYRNVVVCRYDFEPGELPYDVPAVPGIDASLLEVDFTHAFLPCDAFDDVVERRNRVCARRGDAFVGLVATKELSWGTPHEEVSTLLPYDPKEPYELVAAGGHTTWICELGTPTSHGSFDAFVDGVTEARLETEDSGVTYSSPSLGDVELGGTGTLVVDGNAMTLSGYPRFDSPHVTADLGATRYEIRCDGESLTLDFDGH